MGHVIRLSSGREFGVIVSRHGLLDFRARVYQGAPIDDWRALDALPEHRDDWVYLHSLPTGDRALAEAVLYVGAEHTDLGYVCEVLNATEAPRAQLIHAVRVQGSTNLALNRSAQQAMDELESERRNATELRRRLDELRANLAQCEELCATLARQRDEREVYIHSIAKGVA